VTPAYAYDQLLVFQGAVGTFSGKTWTAPTGTTERADSTSTANSATGLADQTLGAIAATGTRVSTFGASANLATVMVALAQPPSLLYLHEDQLGSVRMLTDTAGVVRGTFTYNPYGAQSASTGTSTTLFGFAGQYRDAETGFYYLQTRYYDPSLGQFLSVDPLVEETQMPYAYVSGDPINETDPNGDFCGLWGSNTCVGDALSAISQFVGGNAPSTPSSTAASGSCSSAATAAETVGAESGGELEPAWLGALGGLAFGVGGGAVGGVVAYSAASYLAGAAGLTLIAEGALAFSFIAGVGIIVFSFYVAGYAVYEAIQS
jgi:RHS repeat-associated protein